MENLKEKVSYLKGLSDGLKVDESTSEGKLLVAIIDVLDSFADAIDNLDEAQEELGQYVEDLDDNLSELEDDYYDGEVDEYVGNEGYYEVECPVCHDTVVVEEEVFFDEDNITCPNCNSEIDIDFECGCECDCECGCEQGNSEEK